MTTFLKEVGRGKRGARDLSYDEALEAANWIMTRKASPAQIGAFFIAERIKMESVEELEAFVNVCRSYSYRTPFEGKIDCAGPYDGRKKSFFASFATAFLLGSAGVAVTLHGSAPLPPKWGVTLPDLLKAMGLKENGPDRETVIRTAEQTGILYVPAEQWCPPLGELRSIREELGMRTVLNTAEKLMDYGRSPYIVFGVFHNTVFDRMARLMSRLNYSRALIVQGTEGSEDLFIDRPTRTYLVENGEAKMQVIDPEAYGLEMRIPQLEGGWSPAEQLRITEAVLRGEADMAFTNQVLLNGAVRLWLADQVNSIEQGLYISKALLENGQAWTLYSTWRDLLLADKTEDKAVCR